MSRECKCISCGKPTIDHAYSLFPDKSWTKEELDQWLEFHKAEDLEAEVYMLKTRSELVSIIEGLYKVQQKFDTKIISGRTAVRLKGQLRSDVKDAVVRLLSLI